MKTPWNLFSPTGWCLNPAVCLTRSSCKLGTACLSTFASSLYLPCIYLLLSWCLPTHYTLRKFNLNNYHLLPSSCMSTSCFPYFQFLLQLPKISSIILILQISKLRYRTIKGLVSWLVSQYASKLESEVRPIWFQCLVLPVLSQFPTSHMLPYLAQMSPE